PRRGRQGGPGAGGQPAEALPAGEARGGAVGVVGGQAAGGLEAAGAGPARRRRRGQPGGQVGGGHRPRLRDRGREELQQGGGRPPVTNLYSSAVFIGWGCVLLCLLVEYLFRNGIGSAVAGLLGFATMVIAHHLGGSGDTMEVLQAVLDTNFWLATHVTAVTLG